MQFFWVVKVIDQGDMSQERMEEAVKSQTGKKTASSALNAPTSQEIDLKYAIGHESSHRVRLMSSG